MALKAYKHLTDGEVKIVVEGSAEETSLLDTDRLLIPPDLAGHRTQQHRALWGRPRRRWRPTSRSSR
jgi:hypothetical protein